MKLELSYIRFNLKPAIYNSNVWRSCKSFYAADDCFNPSHNEDDRINPLTDYEGKKVVVYGKIKIYKGAPEVVIGSPSQIEVW